MLFNLNGDIMNIKDFLSKSSTKKIISSVVVLILAAIFGITKFSDSGVDDSRKINVNMNFFL